MWSYPLTLHIWWFGYEGVPHTPDSPQTLPPNSGLGTFAPFVFPCLRSPCGWFFVSSSSRLTGSHRGTASLEPRSITFYHIIFFSLLLLSLSGVTILSSCLLSLTVLIQLDCQRPEQGLVGLDHSSGPELGLKNVDADNPPNFLNVPHDSPFLCIISSLSKKHTVCRLSLSLLLDSWHPAPVSLQHCWVLTWAQPCTCHVLDDVTPGRTLDTWRGPKVSKSRLVCQKASVRFSSGSCRPLPLSLALHSRTWLRAVGQRFLDGGSPVYPSCSRQILLFQSLPTVSRPPCMASLLKTRGSNKRK